MIGRLRRLLRRHSERIFRPRGAVVLLYHRVAEEDSDPYGLCISVAEFEEHLRVIRSLGNPIALGTLADTVGTGAIPAGAVSVSFDDGYVDNLSNAVPLLEKYEIPATIFVVAGPAGREREFWWDRLERIFLQPDGVPDTLEISIDRVMHHWRISGASQARVERGWNMFTMEAPTDRHLVFQDLFYLIQPLSDAHRTAVLDELAEWSGVDERDVRPSRRAMTREEVARAAGTSLIRIGAHTMTHPTLPAQTSAVQEEEITRSKSALERWTGRPVEGFAYPYGSHDDDTVAIVRRSGFAFACSVDRRPVSSRDDPFLIPRMEITSCSAERLAATLKCALR